MGVRAEESIGRGGKRTGECMRDGEGGRLKVNRGGKGNVECRVRSISLSQRL